MNSIYEDILVDLLVYTNISEIHKFHLMSKIIHDFMNKHEDYIWRKILFTNNIIILSNEYDTSMHYQNYTLTCPKKFPLKKMYISDFHHRFIKLQKDVSISGKIQTKRSPEKKI